MKLNRFFTLAAIALLVVGAMGAIASRSFALGSHNPVAGVSAQVDACAQDQADGGAEVKSTTDTDNVELQCGDKNAADTGIKAADTDNVQEQVGDQSSPDISVETPEAVPTTR